MRTRTKICGITNLEDALYAIECGADALGFVFYPPSPRYITVQKATEIVMQLPPFVTIVGLFVDEKIESIEKIISQVKIDLLQFHGAEDENFCRQFNRPYIKAIRMKAETDLHQAIKQYPCAKAILLDTYVKGLPGGTGETFNWQLAAKKTTRPIILAGGLNPENIQNAIKIVRPFAVDVSGGVEKESDKSNVLKDHTKIKNFIRNVNETEYTGDTSK